jgi:hypothetical protein
MSRGQPGPSPSTAPLGSRGPRHHAAGAVEAAIRPKDPHSIKPRSSVSRTRIMPVAPSTPCPPSNESAPWLRRCAAASRRR